MQLRTNDDYARCYRLKKRILISIGNTHPDIAMTYCIGVMTNLTKNPVCERAIFSSDVMFLLEANNNCLRLRWQYTDHLPYDSNDDEST